MLDLVLLHVDLDAADRIDDLRDALKADHRIVADVQVQIFVQHLHGLGRSAVGIGRVGLRIGPVPDIQVGVPVDAHQLDVTGLLIDGGDDHHVRAIVPLIKGPGDGVHAKDRDVPVARHRSRGHAVPDLLADGVRDVGKGEAIFLHTPDLGKEPHEREADDKDQDKKQDGKRPALSPAALRSPPPALIPLPGAGSAAFFFPHPALFPVIVIPGLLSAHILIFPIVISVVLLCIILAVRIIGVVVVPGLSGIPLISIAGFILICSGFVLVVPEPCIFLIFFSSLHLESAPCRMPCGIRNPAPFVSPQLYTGCQNNKRAQFETF